MKSRYPRRPKNHGLTLPFRDLYLTVFDPLNENRKKPAGAVVSRKKLGPHSGPTHNPHEIRQHIIERFISRWRQEVGNDIYPAFRLIIPEKDRERPMYGLKENTIAKYLIDVMKIDKQSEDGYNLINWKQPGLNNASKMAGDFAGRCYEIIKKRPMLSQPGNMSIGEVNDVLDKLAAAQGKESQTPIFAEFYNKMNADELLWLIRIILRQMKVGATEKTFFNVWHPDADSLFNISSSLRRVCWELYDPKIRLEGDDRGVTLMQCFQPQLAQFQMHSIEKMVEKMRPTEDDGTFWIEEKLDGERMQLHMTTDNDTPGGKRFKFWSRKATDYTSLYGNGLLDKDSALTQHLQKAFHQGVRNIILDGEMITWDPEQDAMVAFGTLKTAANIQAANPFSQGWRPFYKVFDILYLNDYALTNYTLRDRRQALQGAIIEVPRRLEIHKYKETSNAADVEPVLRKVVAEASEGLVLKNPRSAYRLNERNDNWMKVKPEYMTEFGENLDCCIIAGYYGTGHRGGGLSSFLCGLRVDENQISQGASPMRFYSFFKVGGGFTAADYANIRHKTDGKWKKWDRKRPPTEYIALGGDHLQLECPDEWILPSDSVVVEVKAASVSVTDQFKMGYTLRFPRFKKIRSDRDWNTALSISGFMALKSKAEHDKKENQFKVDDSRRKRLRVARKKPVTVAGGEATMSQQSLVQSTDVFEGLNVYVMTGAQKPEKKSKAELEALVKTHKGNVCQNDSRLGTVCVGGNRTVHVASAIKRGDVNIVQPAWLFDNIKQSAKEYDRPILNLPLEPRHMLFMTPESEELIRTNVDQHGDSYARDVSVEELKEILESMPSKFERTFKGSILKSELLEHDNDLGELRGWIFEGLSIYVDVGVGNGDDPQMNGQSPKDLRVARACNLARFAGAQFVEELQTSVTHVLCGQDRERNQALRRQISSFGALPRLVSVGWIEQSWAEQTRLDEERFAPL